MKLIVVRDSKHRIWATDVVGNDENPSQGIVDGVIGHENSGMRPGCQRKLVVPSTEEWMSIKCQVRKARQARCKRSNRTVQGGHRARAGWASRADDGSKSPTFFGRAMLV